MKIPEKYNQTKLRVGDKLDNWSSLIYRRSCYRFGKRVCTFLSANTCRKTIKAHNKKVQMINLLLDKPEIRIPDQPSLNATEIAIGSLLIAQCKADMQLEQLKYEERIQAATMARRQGLLRE